jgi:prepilin-type N-terminal cleavage/methylation domain-containing protein
MRQVRIQSHNHTREKGFTLIETVVVMGVFAVLVGISTISFFSTQKKASLNTTLDSFVTDLKEQQLKSMIGDTEGRGVRDSYGIQFGTNSYTLFHGEVFNQADSANFTVNLGDGITIILNQFPNGQIRFASGSGEVVNFTQGSNAVTFRDTTGSEQRTVQVNRYGVITAIN